MKLGHVKDNPKDTCKWHNQHSRSYHPLHALVSREATKTAYGITPSAVKISSMHQEMLATCTNDIELLNLEKEGISTAKMQLKQICITFHVVSF